MIPPITPALVPDLATLHSRCFEEAEIWSTESFVTLMAGESVYGFGDGTGFILCRRVADEAEILTLCVETFFRRQGRGGELLEAALGETARRQLTKLHLEVAEDNTVAIAFYKKHGFRPSGRREGYYRRKTGAVAAVLLCRDIP